MDTLGRAIAAAAIYPTSDRRLSGLQGSLRCLRVFSALGAKLDKAAPERLQLFKCRFLELDHPAQWNANHKLRPTRLSAYVHQRTDPAAGARWFDASLLFSIGAHRDD